MFRKRFHPQLEFLENRLTPALPAAGLAVGESATYTDGNGDMVEVLVRGTAGTAVFNGGVDVDNADITAIAINNASKKGDFSIAFRHIASGGTDDILLGEITVNQNRQIRGVYINPLISTSLFSLASFTGNGLSAKGSINVSEITGNGSGVGIDVKQHSANRSINVLNDVAANADISIATRLAGNFNVGGNLDGDLTVTGTVDPHARIRVGADVTGNVSVSLNFGGVVTIGGAAIGAWNVLRNVTAPARLHANDGWADFNVLGTTPLKGPKGNFNGQLASLDGTIDLNVLRDVQGQARITAALGVVVDAGRVLGGAVVASTGLGTVGIHTVRSFGGTVTTDTGLVLLADQGVSKTALLSFDSGIVKVTGNFAGNIQGNTLDIDVSASVAKFAYIQVNTIADSLDPGDDAFFVGGNFAGFLEVGGDFTSGSDPTETLVTGDVLASAIFSVGAFVAGPATYRFGNNFFGQLIVNGDLDVNLAIAGTAVGPKQGIYVGSMISADITIGGSLGFLSSNSFFDNGNFLDGDGTVIGTLAVTGTTGIVLPAV